MHCIGYWLTNFQAKLGEKVMAILAEIVYHFIESRFYFPFYIHIAFILLCFLHNWSDYQSILIGQFSVWYEYLSPH